MLDHTFVVFFEEYFDNFILMLLVLLFHIRSFIY